VKKGEKGIQILAPMIGTRRKRQEEAEQDGTGKSAPVLVGFRAVYVFDVSQTEGAELPAPATVTGEAGTHLDRLIDFVTRQGIELEYNERIAPAQGASYGGKIVLLPGQSKAETFATLVHELGHEMLHKADRRTATTKGRPKPRPSPLSWAKPSDSRPAPLPPTTSSFTTATPHCWRKALKLSSAHPP